MTTREDEIRARWEKATSGRWEAYCIGSEGYTIRATAKGGATITDNYDMFGFSGYIGEIRGGKDWEQVKANGEALGSAKEDIDYLLKENERRLSPEAARLILDKMEQVRVENQRLQEALSEMLANRHYGYTQEQIERWYEVLNANETTTP